MSFKLTGYKFAIKCVVWRPVTWEKARIEYAQSFDARRVIYPVNKGNRSKTKIPAVSRLSRLWHSSLRGFVGKYS